MTGTERETTVGFVGDGGRLADAVAEAGGHPVGIDPEAIEPAEGVPTTVDPDLLVAVGEGSLVALARARPSSPVLPVEARADRYELGTANFEAAVDRILAGGWTTAEHPLLAARAGGERHAVALDAMLITSEPARISEYGVHVGDEHRTSFRADGVVAATPLGSTGYASAAGGPILDPGAGVSIVPVAPFSTRSDTWVVTPTLALSVERDEDAVSLVIDGEAVGAVTQDERVTLSSAGSLSLVDPDGL